MADKFVHNKSRYPTKEIFARMEEKFGNISCNMSLVMVAPERNHKPFSEVGGLNSNIISNGKLGDNETPKNDLKK
jgi:hypothetical protein